VIVLFGLAIFLSAGLVFLVQPMTAKLLLPTFGGSPQVWTAATVFFQAALLVGYGYAHMSIRSLGLRRQPLLHAALLFLPLLVLPIGLRGLNAAGQLPPAIAVLAILLVSVGAPYVAVSATSPVLQRWFSATGHRTAADPYFLYAAGNVGSLIGLLGYPLLIEPNLRLADQALVWSIGYVAFVVLCLGCAVVLARRASAIVDVIESHGDVGENLARRSRPIDALRRLGWIVRAFIPSSLMLGVTTYSSTDIAAVPLLWAIPLSIYLLTFVLAFSRRRILSTRTWARILPFTTVVVVLTILGVIGLPVWLRLAIHYLGFFVAAMVAHSQLADDRPTTDHLTQFYLLVAVGGVLGGVFNALIAQLVFDAILEYPLVIAAALFLRTSQTTATAEAGDGRSTKRGRRLELLVRVAVYLVVLVLLVVVNVAAPQTALASRLVIANALAVSLILVGRPVRFALIVGALLAITFLAGQPALYSDRTFFGLNRVIDNSDGHRVFLSGSTIHGAERLDEPHHPTPLSYFHPSGPVGQVMASLNGRPAEIAVIGLGTGSLASYGEPGQHMTFVDIDRAVIRIATNPNLFRFIADSQASIDIAEADGRLWLAAQPNARFDLIVLDAFSSDAIPAHVVTREAMAMYVSKLRPGGRLAFNVSNTYLDVQSVVVGGARSLGLAGYARHDADLSVAPPGDKEVSDWVVVAPDAAAVSELAKDARWTAIDRIGRTVVWTDDFSDVLGVLK
jgi:SAM-dependent methyltransferase